MSTADINLRTVLILFFAESSEKSEKRPEKRRKSEENRGQDYLEDDYCMGVFSQWNFLVNAFSQVFFVAKGKGMKGWNKWKWPCLVEVYCSFVFYIFPFHFSLSLRSKYKACTFWRPILVKKKEEKKKILKMAKLLREMNWERREDVMSNFSDHDGSEPIFWVPT